MAGLKKQTFLQGAAVLVGANLLVKLIGAAFKLPLAALLGERGMAIFNTAYNLYAVLFVIATAGLPVAVSKMVAESAARRNFAEARRIFHAALCLLGLIGVAGMLVLLLGARLFAELVVGSPQSYLSILMISPAILFIALTSAFRGYFQGLSTMTPTALSEIAEALGKLVIGLLLAWLLLSRGPALSSAGAIAGVTAGSLFACAILVMTFMKNRKQFGASAAVVSQTGARPVSRILLSLLKIAVPITIGAAVSSLTNIIDLIMIQQRLRTIFVTPELSVALTQWFGLPIAEASADALMQLEPAQILYGAYSGFAIPLFNLPPTIVAALSMSVVPAISGAYALGRDRGVRQLTQSAVRITTLFALPCSIGMSVLAAPILTILFNNARSQTMLSILSLSIVFVCLVSVTTAILQATGNVMAPVFHMLAGGLVKIATNYFLIAMPAVHINGAPISTILCYLTIAILNLLTIVRTLHPGLRPMDFIVKPLACALAMGFAAWGVYQIAAQFLALAPLSLTPDFLPAAAPVTPVEGAVRFKTAIALACSIGVGGLVYFFMLFAVGGVKREDVEMLPKGRAAANFLDRFHLLK